MRKFQKIIIVNVREQDDDALRNLSKRLDLSISECMRRALRLGMERLRRTNLPGKFEEEKIKNISP